MKTVISLPEVSTDWSPWIGRSTSAVDVATEAAVARFVATFDGLLAPRADEDAPLGLHWCLATDAVAAGGLGDDGHPAKGGFLPPVWLPRRMWAGGEVCFRAPLRVGARVERHSRIASVAAKSGRSGPMVFVAVRHDYVTDLGCVIEERQDIVYRDAVPAEIPSRVPERPETEPPAAVEVPLTIGPVLLFRWSAMTFNAHRIHYDLPYATEVEHHPGLIVHGPLQATLLLNRAAAIGGRPARFEYRCLAPWIGGTTGSLCTGEAGTSPTCWIRNADGRLSASGVAAW